MCEQDNSQVTTFGRQKDIQRNYIYVYTHIHIYVLYIHIYKSLQKWKYKVFYNNSTIIVYYNEE